MRMPDMLLIVVACTYASAPCAGFTPCGVAEAVRSGRPAEIHEPRKRPQYYNLQSKRAAGMPTPIVPSHFLEENPREGRCECPICCCLLLLVPMLRVRVQGPHPAEWQERFERGDRQ